MLRGPFHPIRWIAFLSRETAVASGGFRWPYPRRKLAVLQSDNHIAHLANRAGVTTPTFQVVASVLADFLYRATPLVQEAALAAPDEIKLGRRTD